MSHKSLVGPKNKFMSNVKKRCHKNFDKLNVLIPEATKVKRKRKNYMVKASAMEKKNIATFGLTLSRC